MDTVLFVSATIGFSENLFLVNILYCNSLDLHSSSSEGKLCCMLASETCYFQEYSKELIRYIDLSLESDGNPTCGPLE